MYVVVVVMVNDFYSAWMFHYCLQFKTLVLDIKKENVEMTYNSSSPI